MEGNVLVVGVPKGDALRYSDLTAEQVAELKKPATDAAAEIDKTNEEYKAMLTEQARAFGDAQRARAESYTDAERARDKAYTKAETDRDSAYKEAEGKRQAAEGVRSENEGARKSAETERDTAEKARVEAEAKREQGWTDLKADAEKSVSDAVERADAASKAATKAIADVKASEAKLYPVAENTLKGTAKDAFVHVDDAFSGAALCEITVEGACRQDGTPSPDNPVPIVVIEHPVVKVTGRNLFNPERLASDIPSVYSVDGGILTVKGLDGREWDTIAPYMTLPAGAYITSGDSFEIRDELNNIINPGSFTLANDTRVKIKVGVLSQAYPYVSKAQIERGGTASDYVPYTSQSLAFTLPAEHPYLAKVDNKADEIRVDRDGNVELVARVGVDKNVRKVGVFQRGKYYSFYTNLSPFASPDEDYGGIMLCSTLQSRYLTSNGDGIYRTWNGIYVRDTSGRTKEEIQAEVDKNAPLTVVAKIPETRYPLGKIEMPKAQDSVVNVWTDAEVTPNMGIEYTRDVNIVVANLESAIASIS